MNAIPILTDQVSPEELTMRVNLASCCRLVDLFGCG
jgi:hypothetical protein